MLRSGDKIGPYILIRKLGKGAFGEVWLVEEHDAILSSQFALKILFDEDADLDAVKQEASVWLQASGHPNVLPIHKAAVYDGQFVIVSEFAPDGSLKDWLKQHGGKSPSIKEAIRITDSILAGLEHLHARRIIHRDIKPDNVLMQGSTPRLADFGISRIMKSTVHSQVMAGTPQYMAPEAFRGERDEQTDIWAVGALLYRLTCGRLPFPEIDVYALMHQVANAEPPPLGADVPEPLQKVITKALEKTQATRYQSASAMRGALQAAQRQIEEDERKQRQVKEQKRIEEQKRKQVEERKKQQAVERDAEATIVREPKPVKIEQHQTSKIEDPKPPSTIRRRAQVISPRSAKVKPFVQWKHLPLVSGGVSMVVLMLIAIIFTNKSNELTKSTGTTTSQPSGNTTKNANLSPVKSYTEMVNSVKIEMVGVQGGTFTMGASYAGFEGRRAEDSEHQVTVSSFAMGKYEVTQRQWQTVAQLPKVKMDLKAEPSKFKGDDLPVDKVNWEEALEFCERLSKATGKKYRLPTEAEWEYGCRAGRTGAYSGIASTVAWYNGNSEETTHPVGQKANTWGLCDMQGNVEEWCSDWYSESYFKQSPPVDPTGPNSGSGRAYRGGSWYTDELALRLTLRAGAAPSEYIPGRLGFRLVRIYP